MGAGEDLRDNWGTVCPDLVPSTLFLWGWSCWWWSLVAIGHGKRPAWLVAVLGPCFHGVVCGASGACSSPSCAKELLAIADAMAEGDARASCDHSAVAKHSRAPQNHRRSQNILWRSIWLQCCHLICREIVFSITPRHQQKWNCGNFGCCGFGKSPFHCFRGTVG